MAYNRELFKNMPIYARLADEQGVLEHVCNAIQPSLDIIQRRLLMQQYLYDPDLTPDEFLNWLGQFVGLSTIGNQWLGIGINPEWDHSYKRTLIKRAWNYWQVKGTNQGIREAIALWLRWDESQQERLDIRLPFGKNPTDSPPNWWSWYTPYGAADNDAFPERQNLGSGDTPGQPFTPREINVQIEDWSWDYTTQWNDQQVILAPPQEVIAAGSHLGPERPHMHFYLLEENWNQVLPDVFTLNDESWNIHAVPSVFAWLLFPEPGRISEPGVEGKRRDIEIRLDLDEPHRRIETIREFDVDGFHWSYQWWPRVEVCCAEMSIETEEAELDLSFSGQDAILAINQRFAPKIVEEHEGFGIWMGQQYVEPLGDLCPDAACTEWSQTAHQFYAPYCDVITYRTVLEEIDDWNCVPGVPAEVQVGTEMVVVPGEPAIPPNQLLWVSNETEALLLEGDCNRALLLETSETECLWSFVLLTEDGDGFLTEDEESFLLLDDRSYCCPDFTLETMTEVSLGLVETDAVLGLERLPEQFQYTCIDSELGTEGGDTVITSEEGCPIVLVDGAPEYSNLWSEEDGAIAGVEESCLISAVEIEVSPAADDADYDPCQLCSDEAEEGVCFEPYDDLGEVESIYPLRTQSNDLLLTHSGIPIILDISADDCSCDEEICSIQTLLTSDDGELLTSTGESLLFNISDIECDDTEPVIVEPGFDEEQCAKALMTEDGFVLLSEEGQVLIEEANGHYVCIDCIMPLTTEESENILLESGEGMLLIDDAIEGCCNGMDLILLEHSCEMVDPVKIATFFNVFGLSHEFYFGGCPGTPDILEEVPVYKEVRLCNALESWTTRTITYLNETTVVIPEEELDLKEVYAMLEEVSNSGNWKLMMETESGLTGLFPLTMFWEKVEQEELPILPSRENRSQVFSTQTGFNTLFIEFVSEFFRDEIIYSISLLSGGKLVHYEEFELGLNAPRGGCYGFRFRIKVVETVLNGIASKI